VAGKTGTPQNWSDAWAVGYSPYYTTAVWFGFDKPGNSLGVELTGSTLAGPVWGDYMRVIHQGLTRRDFIRPASGVVDVTVCAKSGLLRGAACNEGDVTLPFLTGTQPTHVCDLHGNISSSVASINNMRTNSPGLDDIAFATYLPPMPSLPPDLFPDLSPAPNNRNNRNTNNANNRRNTPNNQSNQNNQNNRNTAPSAQTQNPVSLNNPLLDGDTPATPPQPLDETVTDNNAADGNTPADFNLGLDIPAYNPLLD
jgi:penicillin-binding protein 1A